MISCQSFITYKDSGWPIGVFNQSRDFISGGFASHFSYISTVFHAWIKGQNIEKSILAIFTIFLHFSSTYMTSNRETLRFFTVHCFCHYWKSDIFASSPFILLLGFFPIDSVILAHLLFCPKSRSWDLCLGNRREYEKHSFFSTFDIYERIFSSFKRW